MKDMILFPEDIDRMNAVLAQLVAKANLLFAVLINKDGRLLTSQGGLDSVDTVSLAALVAGNSASTLAIANLMGETEFSTMYHQGKDKNIYIALVDENTFVSLVFNDRTNIDRVKVFARQFDRQLKEALRQVYDKSEDQIDLDLDMPGGFDNFGSTQLSDNQHQPASDYDVYNPPSQQMPPQQFSAPQAQAAGYADPNKANTPPRKPSANSTPRAQQIQHAEEEAFYLEQQSRLQNQQSGQPQQNNVESPVDTKYLYLQNKIRETVKRKNQEPDQQR